jgi:hypothetical protein
MIVLTGADLCTGSFMVCPNVRKQKNQATGLTSHQ